MIASVLSRAETFGHEFLHGRQQQPQQSVRSIIDDLELRYWFWERLYDGGMFSSTDKQGQTVRADYGLPRNIRMISLAAKRAVDWWPGSVYPGVWTADGLPASNGKPNRIPYDGDTDEEIRLAVQQSFAWANGPQFLSRMVNTGARLGHVLAEIEVHWSDDPTGHKIYPVLVHPKHVVELELSVRGDVRSYRLAIPMQDPQTQRRYIWGKRVTPDDITTYYDDEPHGYDGQPATVPNPYGFVPASWIPHQYLQHEYGSPAMSGAFQTLFELNGIVASVDDYIHRFVRQGVAVITKDPEQLLTLLQKQQTRGATNDLRDPRADSQQLNMIPMPDGTTVQALLQNLGLGEAGPHIDRIDAELEKALPEMVLDEKLLTMDNVTAPGAMALVRRVEQKLSDVAGNYDSMGVVKLGQMCMAIGGHHTNNGDWGLRSRLTLQQQRFLSFSLESYQRNELDFGLTGRELVPSTMMQRLQEAAAIESLSTPAGLRHVGFSADEIYGVDENGKPLAPEPRPGMLSESPAGNAAAVGDALVRTFNAGLVGV
jgi:hypothetical protein